MKEFDSKKEALSYLSTHALACVAWWEGTEKMCAIYWNGKTRILLADAKLKWY